jgi:hypothetical protein
MSATATTELGAETPSERITAAVTSWEGVVAGHGKRGEFGFRLGKREIGHLHGDHAAHFFFPKETWAELHEEGRIGHHPVFPEREGPAARRIESDEDVRDVIALMRVNYEEALARRRAAEAR